ncbi:unnamed protein product [Symbiodinium natans]|uniref:Uncharacterized protein n=1 Tax=Symbiodinium natans TaxID=878477 RepID=A0A812I5Z9_9DINO|nr:unnamed protein product [Symbiodinium natans]
MNRIVPHLRAVPFGRLCGGAGGYVVWPRKSSRAALLQTCQLSSRTPQQTALEYLRELDALLEDELVEEEFYELQVQRILKGAGVSDRTSLANAAEAAPALGPEIAEEDPHPGVTEEALRRAKEQLSELDELLEDELIEEEVHARQLKDILASVGAASREELG